MSRVYSVAQVNRYIKNMFSQDFMLGRISVKGEVSNCKYHTSGHIYFSLKDETGSISCVMFAGNRGGISFSLENGQNVCVSGSVSVYERDGKYQLYAKEIQLDGQGALYEKFLVLKRELEEMGMFDPQYKQPIPFFSRRIGIVTAPTGAAIRDIQNIALRRNPYVELILYPALVQGDGAAQSIVKGIEVLDQMHLDVIIVGRGGGSIEDLWAFNEESVARAVFACQTPVISAVGHETDFTIVDFVADMRAPTPSAAAELAAADIEQVVEQIRRYQQRLHMGMQGSLARYRTRLEALQIHLAYQNPGNRLEERRRLLTEKEEKLDAAMQDKIQEKRYLLRLYAEKMKGLSPLDKLSQGYAYISDERHHTVTSISQVKESDELSVYVRDGCIHVKVLDSRKLEY